MATGTAGEAEVAHRSRTALSRLAADNPARTRVTMPTGRFLVADDTVLNQALSARVTA